MNKLKMQKLKVILLAVVMMGTLSVMAQAPDEMQQPELKEDFKKDELKSFLKASAKVETIQAGVQQSMGQAVEDEGLTIQQFNTMAQAQQSGEEIEGQGDEEDLEKFNNAAQKIMEIQDGIMDDIQECIQEEGLDVQTYEQIIFAYQNSEKVKGEVDEMVLELQQEQQDQAAPPIQ